MIKLLHTFAAVLLGLNMLIAQCIEGNCVNGKGTMVYPSGAKYVGDFKDGRIEGVGVLHYSNQDKYYGEWKNQQRQGKGRMVFKSGDVYFGAFLENKMTGLGKMTYVNGNIYDGEWLSGQPSGQGVMTFKNGDVYSGNFENGLFNGQGEMKYADHSIHRGSWQNGMKHGEGVFITKYGDIVEDEWSEGRLVSEVFGYKKKKGQNPNLEANPDIAPSVQQSDEVKIWALVVGVSSYVHMPSLRFTDDDAYQLYAFLKSPEGGALPDNQLKVLIDENATHQKILEAAQRVLLQADANDVILFYFSGHGLESAFLPVDYDGAGNQLYHDEIKDLMGQSLAKHKIVIADACHSGGYKGIRSTNTIDASLVRYYKAFEDSKGGTALLLSSKEREYSLEDGGLRSGVFSHFIIRGLKGEADKDGDKIVSVMELFQFASQKVRYYTGNMQTPVLTGNFDAGMPLSVIRH